MKRASLPRVPLIEGGRLTGILLDSQPYRFVGLRPYQRQDGEMTELAVWASECADCREPIEITTSVGIRTFAPSRRCQECAAPGKLVRGNRPTKSIQPDERETP